MVNTAKKCSKMNDNCEIAQYHIEDNHAPWARPKRDGVMRTFTFTAWEFGQTLQLLPITNWSSWFNIYIKIN